jgi:hypothetical protein
MVNERGQAYGSRHEDLDAEVAAVRAELHAALGSVTDEAARKRITAAADRKRLEVESRYAKRLREHANQHGQRVRRGLFAFGARFQKALGRGIPTHRYEFGLHALRGSCAYAIYVEEGLGAAAAYLGDTEETTRKSYSAIDGLNVDSRVLRAAARSAAAESARFRGAGTPAAGGRCPP